MNVLRGEPLHPSTYSDIEEQLRSIFYDIIFKPIVELLAPKNAQVKAAAKELRNARTSSVVNGVLSGKIQYEDGKFSGDFNAAMSKDLRSYGAKFNKQDGTFSIPLHDLPVEVLKAVNDYAHAAKQMHDELEKRLAEIQRGLEGSVRRNPVNAVKVVGKMERGFNATYGEAIGREELSDRAKRSLSKGYSDNMELWIKNFCEEQITELRGIVEENAKKGYRFDRLVKKVQGRYDVSKTKAEFLARQETSLFVSEHRKERFTDAGVIEYIWRTAGDTEVRKGHKELNGRTFRYDDPPIVDEATGRRANPGCDYNCRCVDEPVIPGVLN